MPGFASRTIPRLLSALKSVFARFAYNKYNSREIKIQEKKMQKKINSGLFLQIAEVTHINCKKQKNKERK